MRTPRTEAGRRFIERHGTSKTLEVCAIEDEASGEFEAIAADLVRLGETEVDDEGCYVSLNNQLARLMGRARGAIAGRRVGHGGPGVSPGTVPGRVDHGP